MHNLTKVAALMGLALGVTATAAAQNNATINATAVVQQPIVVSATRTLDFGNVFPGVAKAIAVAAATSGEFSVTGQASTAANMTFVLPANLTNGGNNLPIGTWTGYWNTANNATAGGTAFTPSAGATGLTFSGTGGAFVFVGATVTPSVGQVAGTYNGTVQMTVTY
jgi:hypothetical protein